MIQVQNEPNTNLDIMIQDQTSEIIDLYMLNLDDAINLKLSQGQSIDDKTITVEDATGVLATGVHAIDISENGRKFQAIVTDVTGLVITFNTPLDMDITTNAIIQVAGWNLAVDGSTTMKKFSTSPPKGVSWDITRILLAMESTASMDDSTFGPLDALTNGVVLRKVNGITKNIFTVTNNGGLAERMYDVVYPTKVPAGVYAMRARRTFAGQDKNGVTIRLNGDTNDKLEFLINDNLSDATFTKFVCVAQGHVVE